MTTVLGVIGVLVVLFVVAAVALRDEAVLVDAPPDRADLALPDEGPVTAGDLARVRFAMVLRGYRMAQVDAVLDRVARELLERDEQLAALSAEVDRLRAQRPEAGSAAFERPVPVGPGLAGPSDPELVAAVVARAEPPRPGTVQVAPAHVVEAERAGHTGSVLLTEDETVLETEPPVEHVPDSGESAEPLPGVTTLPDASPPDPVPFPEPVHTDEPVRAPDQPDARLAPATAAAAHRAPAAPATPRDVAVVAAGRALHLARRLASSRRSG